MLPLLALSMPVMTLNRVVLPAPLGPITEAISPARTSRSTLSRATTPPKRLPTPDSRSSISATATTDKTLQQTIQGRIHKSLPAHQQDHHQEGTECRQPPVRRKA